MPPPKSKAQARFLGAIAGGAKGPRGLSQTEAKNMLRGSKVKGLPARSGGKRSGSKRGPRMRGSGRGGRR
jgi:hypothetical protein